MKCVKLVQMKLKVCNIFCWSQREIINATVITLNKFFLFLVQAIYKKWISIKRKFRVEYLRTKADEENGRCPSTTYPYYDSLKFLIPYCEFYKVLVFLPLQFK